jgi:methionine synthase II (cobalamin-independent)
MSNIGRSLRDRIERARVVADSHRIMAETDCGFETTSGMGHVAEELAWEKLRAFRHGAALRLEAIVLMIPIASIAPATSPSPSS